LAQIKDTWIHELAQDELNAGELVGPDTEALSLFENNFKNEDADFISQALASAHSNREDTHETTPCSTHRYDMVVRPDEIG
jgi:hypothetical protein